MVNIIMLTQDSICVNTFPSSRNIYKKKIIKKINEAKYHSNILDCTLVTSLQEYMTIIVGYLNFSCNFVTVEKSFFKLSSHLLENVLNFEDRSYMYANKLYLEFKVFNTS